ncbi:MAG: DNA polymerase III subunit beta [Ignavibacteria bacterium]|jgi:DNA polymerase-3 subunit beta|nr:DNA polymerase III subunit beta [Ignavibacteria bacterium]MDH7527797.1 DNA polymerase III subunit beta [Ignavibacteria bacterium]
MEFKINTKDLDKILSQLSLVLPSKTTVEITNHFLLTLKDNHLTIFATDFNVAYQKTLPVFSDGEIQVAVPGKIFNDTVSNLPDTDLKVTFNQDEKKCVIHTDTGKYIISYVDPMDFPKFPQFEGKLTFKISGERLKEAFNLTEFACGKDEQRAAMRGILMDLKKDKLVFVSTDGHRLVKLTYEDYQPEFEAQLIIPAKSAEQLTKILDEKEVLVTIGDRVVKFEFDGGLYFTRLIDDTYPNYETVIPLDNDNVMKVNRTELLKTLRRASYYIHSKIRRIDLEISNDMLSLTAENPELGTQMNEKILCEYKGEKMQISFKHDFIADALEHIYSDEVVFKFNSPIKPCIIEPSEQKGNENLLILVMPMRVNI